VSSNKWLRISRKLKSFAIKHGCLYSPSQPKKTYKYNLIFRLIIFSINYYKRI
jgi:hypothetical protein